MIFNFRKRDRQIIDKEMLITKQKTSLHRKIDSDIRKQDKLNKALSNGVTLAIKGAIGGRHD